MDEDIFLRARVFGEKYKTQGQATYILAAPSQLHASTV